MASNPQDLSELEKDPRLFLYTSLTAGSSHIVTATSRIETILRANRVPFAYIDTATNEKAKRLWVRRAGGRKLPALVKDGFVIGDLDQVEEWNEFGELKEAIGPCPPAGAPVAPPALPLPVRSTATAGTSKVSAPTVLATKAAPTPENQQPIALPGAAEIAARNNPLPKSSPDDAAKPETMTSAPAEKEKSIKAAEAVKAESKYDHLSAPASAIVSGTATPAEKGEEEKEKEESTPAADKSKHEEHLSVPASALQSGTATPGEESEDTEASEEPKAEDSKTAVEAKASDSVATQTGSDVKSAPVEEIKKAEEAKKATPFRESFIKERSPASSSSASIASLAERIQGMQVGDGKNVGEQEAGKAEDAVKSVED